MEEKSTPFFRNFLGERFGFFGAVEELNHLHGHRWLETSACGFATKVSRTARERTRSRFAEASALQAGQAAPSQGQLPRLRVESYGGDATVFFHEVRGLKPTATIRQSLRDD